MVVTMRGGKRQGVAHSLSTNVTALHLPALPPLPPFKDKDDLGFESFARIKRFNDICWRSVSMEKVGLERC